jgi:gas vesicle protein
MSAGKILLGGTVAFATGAILGVLFAPDKGANTRKKLSKRGTQLVTSLEETYDDAMETAADISEKVKGMVDTLGGHDGRKHVRRA